MQETVRVGSDLHFLPSQTLNRAKVDASLRQRFSGNAFSTLVEVIVFTLGSPTGPFIYYVSTFFLSTTSFSRNFGSFCFLFYVLNISNYSMKISSNILFVTSIHQFIFTSSQKFGVMIILMMLRIAFRKVL